MQIATIDFVSSRESDIHWSEDSFRFSLNLSFIAWAMRQLLIWNDIYRRRRAYLSAISKRMCSILQSTIDRLRREQMCVKSEWEGETGGNANRFHQSNLSQQFSTNFIIASSTAVVITHLIRDSVCVFHRWASIWYRRRLSIVSAERFTIDCERWTSQWLWKYDHIRGNEHRELQENNDDSGLFQLNHIYKRIPYVENFLSVFDMIIDDNKILRSLHDNYRSIVSRSIWYYSHARSIVCVDESRGRILPTTDSYIVFVENLCSKRKQLFVEKRERKGKKQIMGTYGNRIISKWWWRQILETHIHSFVFLLLCRQLLRLQMQTNDNCWLFAEWERERSTLLFIVEQEDEGGWTGVIMLWYRTWFKRDTNPKRIVVFSLSLSLDISHLLRLLLLLKRDKWRGWQFGSINGANKIFGEEKLIW